MSKKKLALIGGFLGAGKTTLLWKMSEMYKNKNISIGLITNDQAAELVDTTLLSKIGHETIEVNGSCFCCNYAGFQNAVRSLCEQGCNIILAEPVGSCTDLSATIMQPTKEKMKDEIQILPMVVLVDPTRLKAILAGENSGLHQSSAYIVRKQMDEADIIVINKKDLLTNAEINELLLRTRNAFSNAEVLAISAQTGEGIEKLIQMLNSGIQPGSHLTTIDYDIYAEGEAVLGWMNSKLTAKADTPLEWKIVMTRFMEELSKAFDQNHFAVGHVKTLCQGLNKKEEYVIGNLTGTNKTLRMRGNEFREKEVMIIINARVQIPPEELKKTVNDVMMKFCKKYSIEIDTKAQEALQPGRPNPTYRYEKVIEIKQ